MDYLWQVHFQYSWLGLLVLMAQLAVFYFILHLANQGAARIAAPATWQVRLTNIINYGLHVFEPIAILILLSYFVLIHPFYHGLILLLLLLANLKHLRNYFSGRIVLFDPMIHIGSRLSVGKKTDGSFTNKGIITKTGRLGIQLQTDKGLLFLGYDHLLLDGYNLLDREEKGGFFRLKIGLADAENQALSQDQLQHLLNVSPFINWKQQSTIKLTERSNKNQWMARIALHHEQHLYDFMELLEERGFSCQIAKL